MDKAVLIVKHVEQEGPGMLGSFFEDAGWQLVTVELGRGESLPDLLDGFAAVVMLGGPMNVYEEEAYPFLKKEDLFIREVPITVFQWHEDTFEIPDGGVLLGTSALVRNQAFRMGSSAYGLQFHVEVSLDMVESWMKDEKSVDAEKILRQGAIVREALEGQAATLFNNFRRLAESAVRVKRIMKLFLEKKPEYQRTLWWDDEGKALVRREALSS
jgi:GMP synthase-like glutamine amidotransferase